MMEPLAKRLVDEFFRSTFPFALGLMAATMRAGANGWVCVQLALIFTVVVMAWETVLYFLEKKR